MSSTRVAVSPEQAQYELSMRRSSYFALKPLLGDQRMALQEAHKEFKKIYYAETPPRMSELDAWFLKHSKYHHEYDLLGKIEPPVFQILSKENIDAIAHFLNGRRNVVEVGSGDGMLSYWLSKKGVPITATDPYMGFNTEPVAPINVDRVDYETALKKYRPDAVVSSWMPPERDWTPSFRESKSVAQYILMGWEDPRNVCGASQSWDAQPGWKREEIPGFVGLGRPDYVSLDMKSILRHTVAVSFVREMQPPELPFHNAHRHIS